MNREDIIRMAREAGFSSAVGKHIALDAELERFAALVAAHVRETERKPWVGLSTDEMKAIADRYHLKPPNVPVAFRAIEAKLREKNHG